jgi:hypothetical protein
MGEAEMERRYQHLKDELARAYSSFTWDSSHIDQLAGELLAIERLSRIRESLVRMDNEGNQAI